MAFRKFCALKINLAISFIWKPCIGSGCSDAVPCILSACLPAHPPACLPANSYYDSKLNCFWFKSGRSKHTLYRLPHWRKYTHFCMYYECVTKLRRVVLLFQSLLNLWSFRAFKNLSQLLYMQNFHSWIVWSIGFHKCFHTWKKRWFMVRIRIEFNSATKSKGTRN